MFTFPNKSEWIAPISEEEEEALLRKELKKAQVKWLCPTRTIWIIVVKLFVFFNILNQKKVQKQQQLQEWMKEKEAKALVAAQAEEDERKAMQAAGYIALLLFFLKISWFT